jgi:hypothetical protein
MGAPGLEKRSFLASSAAPAPKPVPGFGFFVGLRVSKPARVGYTRQVVSAFMGETTVNTLLSPAQGLRPF